MKHLGDKSRTPKRMPRIGQKNNMTKTSSLILPVAVTMLFIAACDNYSHNSIVNTPPINFVNLTMLRTYGGDGYDWGTSLAITKDNEFVITGSTTSNGYGLNTVYLSRIGATGNVVWYTWMGGWGDDNGEAVLVTPDSAILVAGVTSSFDIETGHKIDPNSGKPLDDSSFYLIKTNMDGLVLWEKAFGDLAYDEWATSVAISADGYLAAGYQRKTESDRDLYIVKVDKNGSLMWQISHGTPNSDFASAVVRHSSGGYVLGGYTGNYSTSACDPYLVRVNESGDVLWERILGDSTQNERLFSICETSDGGIAACGASRPLSSAPEADILFALKTDASGQLLWHGAYSQSSLSQGRCIVEDSRRALLICGQAVGENAIHIAKIDASGNLMWSDSTGATGFGMAMVPYGPGYAITGSTTFPNHQAMNDVLLLKIEEDLTNLE